MMAQKIVEYIISDLDGGPADETIRFGLEGTEYEIDLSWAHGKELREALAKFVEHARTVSRGGGRGGATGRTRRSARDANAIDTNACRTWLKENGYEEVKDRGRIPADLVAIYQNRDSVTTVTQAPVPPVRLVEPEAPKEATKAEASGALLADAVAQGAADPSLVTDSGRPSRARAPRKPRAAKA
jgi:hypothetical protein